MAGDKEKKFPNINEQGKETQKKQKKAKDPSLGPEPTGVYAGMSNLSAPFFSF